jgi:hypothetical protein
MATVLDSGTTRPRRFFYTGIVAVLILAVLAGFAPSYVSRIEGAEPIPGFVHAHAAVFTLWLLVMLAQTLLIGAGRTDWHRRLGLAAAVLVLPMLALGYQTAIFGARRGHPFNFVPGAPFADSLESLIVPLFDLALFAGFVGAALLLRHRPEAHKRLMILGGIGGFVWPAITRIPGIVGEPLALFGLPALLVLALPIHDLVTRRRVHLASVAGVVAIVASFLLRRAIAGSELWHAVAAWLTR